MHIVLGALGLVVLVSVWWWRLKAMKQVADDVLDSAGHLRGKYRRRKFRKASGLSPLTAIDDPVVAAATVIFSLTTELRLPDKAGEQALSAVLAPLSTPEKVQDTVAYALWATRQVPDTVLVIDKVAPFLRTCLNAQEKEQMMGLVDDMARRLCAESPVSGKRVIYTKRLARLRQKLGLPDPV